MARSFSNAKLLSVTVMDRFSSSLIRRGYVAASGGGAAAAAAAAVRSSNAKRKTEEEIVRSGENVSWVPDPVTGYYRPENQGNEVDVAELRASLLNKNKK